MSEYLEDDEYMEEDELWTESEVSIFKDLKADFKGAKKAKQDIDNMIADWNGIYEGIFTKKARKNRSKLVMKEVAKQIEWQKPEMTSPFVSTSQPIRVNSVNQANARVMQKYANSQFTGQFNRDDFIEQLTDVKLREGTAWVKAGWTRTEKVVKQNFPNMTIDQMLARDDEPTELTQNKDGSFDVTYEKVVVKENHPNATVERNENCFPDPSARTVEELRFFAIRVFKTLSELRASGLYDEAVLAQLKRERDESNDGDESSLAQQRDNDSERYGVDNNFKISGKNRGQIAIIQYWGEYDIDKSGVNKQIVAEWAETTGINLRLDENPHPSNQIPFFNDVYSKRPFSLWGNALAFFVSDNQEIKSGIMRGIMDNMSQANNGQRFFQRGAIDYVNFKKMRNGERDIVLNKPPKEAYVDGSFNQLPPSVLQTLEIVNRETKNLAGTPDGGEQSSVGKSGEDSEQALTMAQSRMISAVRSSGNLLSKVVKEWLSMANVFLDNEQIEDLFTHDEAVLFNAFNEADIATVKLKVATGVAKMQKLKQLNMLMQQSKTLGEQMPKEQLNSLVAEMYEEFDMYEDADKLRQWKQPPPSHEQQMMQKLEVAKIELEVAKIEAEIGKIRSETAQAETQSQLNMADAQATVQYKNAQTEEKLAKAQAYRVDTALKPVQVQIDADAKKKEETKTQGE